MKADARDMYYPLSIDPDHRMHWLPLLVESCKRKFDDYFHCHDFVQIWYVLEGEVIHKIGDETFHMTEGDVSVVLPYIKHYIDHSTTEEQPPHLLSLSFPDSFLIDHGYRFFSYANSYARFEEAAVPTFVKLSGKSRKTADELSEKMLNEFARHKNMNFDVLAAYLAEFLRLFCIGNAKDKGFICIRESANAITNSIRYMKSNIGKKITLDELCNVACMSRSMYTRNFRAVTGKSSAQFLLSMRIVLAKHMLTFTDMKIDDIAQSVGLNDKTRLAHVFAEYENTSPSKYRACTRNPSKKQHQEFLERWAWFNPADFEEHDISAR